MSPVKKNHKLADVMYGVFDVTMLSLRPLSADDVFRTLTEAFEYIGGLLDEGASDETRYEVYVCRYSQKSTGWYPAPGSRGISIDARYFTPIEDFEQ